MIQKRLRLKEREVKKVLRFGKPFFSALCVVKFTPNKLSHHRFAIVLGGKSVSTNVERNFFRRRFYDMVVPYISHIPSKSYDIVLTLKKKQKLDKKDFQSIDTWREDVKYILATALKN